jgi:hypothetical protein
MAVWVSNSSIEADKDYMSIRISPEASYLVSDLEDALTGNGYSQCKIWFTGNEVLEYFDPQTSP